MTKRKSQKSGGSSNGGGPASKSGTTLADLGLDLNAGSTAKPNPTGEGGEQHFRFKKFKNSLDSDEDDDEVAAKQGDILDPDDLEGQEEPTIDRDGEIRITPFNMKDELEEGHFDKEGTFIFKKSDEIKDHWLDNIDWIKIKEKPIKDSDSDSDLDEPPVDVIGHYKEMLQLMQPKETILKAIKRLGGNSKTTSSRWSKKKRLEQQHESEVDIANREKLVQLTALADKILSTGDMDIYQQTYERLQFLVNAKSKAQEDAADMFGDEFDASEVATIDAEKRLNASEAMDIPSSSVSGGGEVMWEFKWEEGSDAPVYGPHPSSEMLRWVEEGYFKEGVLVRKVSEVNGPFYTSNRIDFDLYT